MEAAVDYTGESEILISEFDRSYMKGLKITTFMSCFGLLQISAQSKTVSARHKGGLRSNSTKSLRMMNCGIR
jgi:hypothetical protein